MSIKDWPGGRVSPTPPTPTGPFEDGAASGIWTLDQMSYWLKQGLWPIAGNVVVPRVLFAGGDTSGGYVNVIQYVSPSTTGNATDFGDLINTPTQFGGFGSNSRGVFGGNLTGDDNIIQYVTFASTGNATDFGDLPEPMGRMGGASNQTRGLFMCGYGAVSQRTNVINYVTIASAGNATDFGDCTQQVQICASCASPTRALRAGGNTGASNTESNVIDYVTIATTGNATDFGDMPQIVFLLGACASDTRGVFAGGATLDNGSTGTNVISYVTIASTGNASDFGDLVAEMYGLAGASSNTRGLFGGGYIVGSTRQNTIQYITIASTGNTTDFGDLITATSGMAGSSNCSGGVQ